MTTQPPDPAVSPLTFAFRAEYIHHLPTCKTVGGNKIVGGNDKYCDCGAYEFLAFLDSLESHVSRVGPPVAHFEVTHRADLPPTENKSVCTVGSNAPAQPVTPQPQTFNDIHPDGVCRHVGTYHAADGSVVCPLVEYHVSRVGPEPPALGCMDCGADYAAFPLDTTLPDEQWRMIHDSDGGVLCASCIVRRAGKLPKAVALRARIEFVGAPALTCKCNPYAEASGDHPGIDPSCRACNEPAGDRGVSSELPSGTCDPASAVESATPAGEPASPPHQCVSATVDAAASRVVPSGGEPRDKRKK